MTYQKLTFKTLMLGAALLTQPPYVNAEQYNKNLLLGAHLNFDLALTGVNKNNIQMVDLRTLRIFKDTIFVEQHIRSVLEKSRGFTTYERFKIDCAAGTYLTQVRGIYNANRPALSNSELTANEGEKVISQEKNLYCQFLSGVLESKTDLEKSEYLKSLFLDLNLELLSLAPASSFTAYEVLTKKGIEKFFSTKKFPNEYATALGKYLLNNPSSRVQASD